MLEALRNLDEIDRTILRILQDDAKITNSQLAKEIGLSPAPTLERVRKLESSGIIKSYHAVLNPEYLGIGVGVFLQITLSSHKKHQIQSFVQKMKAIEQVVECHHITGSGDFLIKILTLNMKTYHEFILTYLIDVEEIGNMQSMIILKTYKQSRSFDLS